jgi:hypothetical protein
MREPDNRMILRLPVIEIIAPAEIMMPPAMPRKRVPASASGFLDRANSGSVPMQTTWTRM